MGEMEGLFRSIFATLARAMIMTRNHSFVPEGADHKILCAPGVR